MRKALSIFTMLVVVLVGIIGIIYSPFSPRTVVEAQSPQILQIQREIQFRSYDKLRVVCDPTSGNQYVTYHANGNDGGVALQVVLNGCQKNPR